MDASPPESRPLTQRIDRPTSGDIRSNGCQHRRRHVCEGLGRVSTFSMVFLMVPCSHMDPLKHLASMRTGRCRPSAGSGLGPPMSNDTCWHDAPWSQAAYTGVSELPEKPILRVFACTRTREACTRTCVGSLRAVAPTWEAANSCRLHLCARSNARRSSAAEATDFERCISNLLCQWVDECEAST